jgi:hypothetical protein
LGVYEYHNIDNRGFKLYRLIKSKLNFFSESAGPALDIKEGDVFYALATFVSETGEAMNLVEGERVFVLEWNNQVCTVPFFYSTF